jgi:hypothetical protein
MVAAVVLPFARQKAHSGSRLSCARRRRYQRGKLYPMLPIHFIHPLMFAQRSTP